MAVAHKSQVTGLNANGKKATLALSFAGVSGDTLVVSIAAANTTAAVTSVTDDKSGGSHTYTRRDGARSFDQADYDGSNMSTTTPNPVKDNYTDCEIFTATLSASITTVTVTMSDGCVFVADIQSYTGVSAIGAHTSTTLQKAQNPSGSLTTTASNSIVVGAFASAFASNPTASAGTLRGKVSGSNTNRCVALATLELAKAVAGATTVGLTAGFTANVGGQLLSVIASYAFAAVELKA